MKGPRRGPSTGSELWRSATYIGDLTSTMGSRADAVAQQEHAIPVRLSGAADPAELAHYSLLVDEAAPPHEAAGGPDAPLRAAVTVLQREGILAAISHDGNCVDVLLRAAAQRGASAVSTQLQRLLPTNVHLTVSGAGESPSTAVLSSCVEQAVLFQLVTEHHFCPVEFHGTKWLVRRADK